MLGILSSGKNGKAQSTSDSIWVLTFHDPGLLTAKVNFIAKNKCASFILWCTIKGEQWVGPLLLKVFGNMSAKDILISVASAGSMCADQVTAIC